MEVVGQRIVDGFDVGIGDQLLVRPVSLGDAKVSGHLLRSREITGRDGGDLAELAALHSGDDLLASDLGRAENAPTYGLVAGWFHGALLILTLETGERMLSAGP